MKTLKVLVILFFFVVGFHNNAMFRTKKTKSLQSHRRIKDIRYNEKRRGNSQEFKLEHKKPFPLHLGLPFPKETLQKLPVLITGLLSVQAACKMVPSVAAMTVSKPHETLSPDELLRLIEYPACEPYNLGINPIAEFEDPLDATECNRRCRNISEKIRLLQKAGLDFSERDRYGEVALHKAVYSDSRDTVQAFIKAGVDLNLSAENGLTALHFAVQHNNLPMVRALIKAGADIDKTDGSEKTALHKAVDSNNMEMFQLLIKAGANIHLLDSDGQTILHYAAWQWNGGDMINALVNLGARINQKDKKGQTPLHTAVESNSLNSVKKLIELGAQIKKDREGLTPLDLARKRGYRPEIVKFLESLK